MFGKKANSLAEGIPASSTRGNTSLPTNPSGEISDDAKRDEKFYEVKRKVFDKLIETIDAASILRLDVNAGRVYISDLLSEIFVSEKIQISASDELRILNQIADDMLGFGPLERLLTRDDISDIMVNGTDPIYVETGGVVTQTSIRFRNIDQLLNVCQRIVSLVGRRVDESSPICDARLKDGSRVNVIIPPISLMGPVLTIRRFKADRLTMNDLIQNGTISPDGAELLRIIARSRCNTLIVGGTGSGKTTLLNVLTAFIDPSERIVTCEDTAELQLQQSHVVRLETRPANVEGKGEITMRSLVKNCLRMRPDRIIVGEVRGPEAFDLLQAMNTGHDGSLGTIHANSPEEAIIRVVALVTMGYGSLHPDLIQRMMAASVDIIIQIDRLRDGSRRITHIAEVLSEEDGSVKLHNMMNFDFNYEEMQTGSGIQGKHHALDMPTGQLLRRASYFGELQNLEAIFSKSGA